MVRFARAAVWVSAGTLVLGVAAWSQVASPRGAAPAPAGDSLEAAIAEVEAGRRTTPLIEASAAGGDAAVTFLARRDGDRVPRVVSDVTGWGEHVDGTFDFTVGAMTRVGRSEWYALRTKVAPGARIEYLLAYALADHRLDPHNPRQSAGPQFGGAGASEFVTPGYVAPPAFTDPPTSPGGRITDATIESRASRRAWRAAVYTPPGHCTGDRLPVAVVLDLRAGQMSRVLDWLIVHRAIPPITAVFVGPVERGLDHPDAAAMRAFLTDELPRWMAAHHASNWQAGDRAIVAISFHAKDALDAALGCGADLSGLRATGCRHDPFNRLGLLIPGRRIARDDIAAIAARRRNRLRVAILAGRYDYANIGTARGVRDALAQAGHGVEYVEVPEGHSAVTWTHHLGRLLVGLYGPAT